MLLHGFVDAGSFFWSNHGELVHGADTAVCEDKCPSFKNVVLAVFEARDGEAC